MAPTDQQLRSILGGDMPTATLEKLRAAFGLPSSAGSAVEMLGAGDPDLNKCVLLCAKSLSGRLTWMVGIFIQRGAGVWFRCDFDHALIPFRNVPGQRAMVIGWMYLPNR